jgi:phosphoglycerate dehydrogenase-like enzyme
MEDGCAKSGITGLKEYQGHPDEIVRFVDKAEVLVTHVAPVSAAMLERMPGLKLFGRKQFGVMKLGAYFINTRADSSLIRMPCMKRWPTAIWPGQCLTPSP